VATVQKKIYLNSKLNASNKIAPLQFSVLLVHDNV